MKTISLSIPLSQAHYFEGICFKKARTANNAGSDPNKMVDYFLSPLNLHCL